MRELVDSKDAGNRWLAAVLLRRAMDKPTNAWAVLPREGHEAVQGSLLQLIGNDPELFICRKVAHAVAQVAEAAAFNDAREYILPSTWPGLLDGVFALTRPEVPAPRRELALQLFSNLVEYVGSALVHPILHDLQATLTEQMEDPHNGVRVAAMRALIRVLVVVSDVERTPFQGLLAPMFGVLNESLKEDEFASRDALQSLMELGATDPGFFRPVLTDAASTLFDILNHEDFDTDTRSSAFELVILLAENAGGMVRKCRPVVERAIPLAASLFLRTEDDELWSRRLDDSHTFTCEEDMDDLEAYAIEALDRLASALGGAIVFPQVQALMAEAFAGGGEEAHSWKQRRAALFTLGLVAEGCSTQILPHLEELTRAVLAQTHDPHPRVRFAALRCLAQFAQDFGDLGSPKKNKRSLGRVTHSFFLPALVEVIDAEVNRSEPRVRGMACLAIVMFCHQDACKRSYLGPDPTPLLRAIHSVLTGDHRTSRETALTALASVSLVLGDEIGDFYSTFIDEIRAILSTVPAPAERLLWNKSLECFGALCTHAGVERCRDDAHQVLTILFDHRGVDAGSFAGDDSESYRYVQSAILRLAQTLGAEFAPHLASVIPGLLATASVDIDTRILRVADLEDEGKAGDLGIAPRAGERGADRTGTHRDGEHGRDGAAAGGGGGRGGAGGGGGDEEEAYDIDEHTGSPEAQVVQRGARGATTVDFGEEGRRVLTYDSHAVACKAIACTILFNYVAEESLAPFMGPYIDEIAGAMGRIFSEISSEEARTAAACAFPRLIKLAVLDPEDPAHVTRLLSRVVRTLANAMKTERSASVLATEAEGLVECLRFVVRALTDRFGPRTTFESAEQLPPPNVLEFTSESAPSLLEAPAREAAAALIDPALLPGIVASLAATFEASVERRLGIAQAREDLGDEFDEASAEKFGTMLEMEDEIVSNVVDCYNGLIRLHRHDAVRVLKETVLSDLVDYLGKDAFPGLKMAATCVLDDCIEFGGEENRELVGPFVEYVKHTIHHKDPDIRQAAVYGVGVLFQHGGEEVNASVGDLLRGLVALVNHRDSRKEENAGCTDNAISALLKALLFRTDNADLSIPRIMQTVLERLPLTGDPPEARVVHRWLVRWVHAGQPMLDSIGPTAVADFAGPLLRTLADMIQAHHEHVAESEDDALIDAETLLRLPLALHHLRAQLPDGAADALLGALPPMQQAALLSVFPRDA